MNSKYLAISVMHALRASTKVVPQPVLERQACLRSSSRPPSVMNTGSPENRAHRTRPRAARSLDSFRLERCRPFEPHCGCSGADPFGIREASERSRARALGQHVERDLPPSFQGHDGPEPDSISEGGEVERSPLPHRPGVLAHLGRRLPRRIRERLSVCGGLSAFLRALPERRPSKDGCGPIGCAESEGAAAPACRNFDLRQDRTKGGEDAARGRFRPGLPADH